MQFLGRFLFYVVVFAVVDLVREKVGGYYALVFIAGVITGHLLSDGRKYFSEKKRTSDIIRPDSSQSTL
jgi:hypothetical protein